MNKKFLNAILFGALTLGTVGTITSCKDYDDEIDEINLKIAGLASQSDLSSQISSLQSSITAAANKAQEGVTQAENALAAAQAAQKAAADAVAEAKAAGNAAAAEAKEAAVAAAAEEVKKAEAAVAEAKAEVEKVAALQADVEALKAEVAAIKEDNSTEVQKQLAEAQAKIDEAIAKLNETATGASTEISYLGKVQAWGDGKYQIYDTSSSISGRYYRVQQADLDSDDYTDWVEESGTTKTVSAGDLLSEISGQQLLVSISPASIDATKLEFKYVNSNGVAAPIDIVAKPFEGTLTRAESGKLWILEPQLQKDAAANVAKLNEIFGSGPRVAFALTEGTTGYQSNYEYVFTTSSLTSAPTIYVSSLDRGIELNIPYTVTFDTPYDVFDSYLEIDEDDISIFGIKVEGMTFTVTKNPGNNKWFNITVHYQNIYKLISDETSLNNFHVGVNYADVSEVSYASQDIVLKATPAVAGAVNPNYADYDLKPLFDALGDNLSLWRSNYGGKGLSIEQVNKETGISTTNWNLTSSTGAGANTQFIGSDGKVTTDIKKAEKIRVNLGAGSNSGSTQYYDGDTYTYVAVVNFYDNAGNETTIELPFTVSLPSASAIAAVTPNADVISGNKATAYLNLNDYSATTVTYGSGFTADKFAYSFKYAFDDFAESIEAAAGNLNLTLAEQPILFTASDNTKHVVLMSDLVEIIGGNTKDAYLKLQDYAAAKTDYINAAGTGVNRDTNGNLVANGTYTFASSDELFKLVYGKAINVKVEATYLGLYPLKATTIAFTVKSPVEAGTIKAKSGSAVKATYVSGGDGSDLIARIYDNTIEAKTVTGAAYTLVANRDSGTLGSGDSSAATSYTSRFVNNATNIGFATLDEDGVTDLGIFTGFAKTGYVYTDNDDVTARVVKTNGYVEITVPQAKQNYLGENVPVTITVKDIWGVTKTAVVNVIVTRN